MNDLLQLALIGIGLLLIAGTAGLLISDATNASCQVAANTFSENVTCQATTTSDATEVTFTTPQPAPAVGWAADNARCVNDRNRFICTNVTGDIELTVSYQSDGDEDTVTGVIQ